MIKLNDDSIIVGQIKQLLHNFNLPKCPIIKEDSDFSNYTGYAIQDSILYYINNGNKEIIKSYLYNSSINNITENLIINTKYYDIKTHLHLGKYLRFLRDYKKINLMSMYNCSIEKTMNDNITFTDSSDKSHIISNTWNCIDNNIYIVPICYDNFDNASYTIYTDDIAEVTLALFNIDTNEEINTFYLEDINKDSINSQLYYKTHKKIYCQSKNRPYLYTINKIDINNLYQYKNYMCLLIKLPNNYQGQLTVLEGDYTNESTSIIQINTNDLKSVEKLINNITKPQLLSNENINNYLLADKLIEYLTDNAISPIRESYDIKKLQFWFNKNRDKIMKLNLNILSLPVNGFWSDSLTYNLIQLYYYYLNTPKYKKTYYDFIGCVDSTMEELFEDADNISIKDIMYNYGGIV